MAVSIFNDVVGPVMRGPSSSHCAAALRIGRLALDLMEGEINEVLVEFDVHGSLPTTHASQGSDMGLFGGLLGWDATDERLPQSKRHLEEQGVRIRIETINVKDPHPNTYRLTLRNSRAEHRLIAISTGGGMMQVISIDGCSVLIEGGYFEMLLLGVSDPAKLAATLDGRVPFDEIVEGKGPECAFLILRSAQLIPKERIAAVSDEIALSDMRILKPVLPVPSVKDLTVPFLTCDELLRYDGGRQRALWEHAIDYECARGNLSREAVWDLMQTIVGIARDSIAKGIEGTDYQDRILGHQSGGFRSKMKEGSLLDGGMLNTMVLYVTALMEMKSSMGVIIAAPTAGACAGFPGGTLGAADFLQKTDDDCIKAMLAGGLIGLFIAHRSTFAAEVSGCQAEGGASSGMTAAALATLGGASLDQTLAASSMALQNCLGMICDPVANRVEAPCLGRNVIAASNALSCANMAMAGFDPVIPLDEVIATMDDVGKSLPRELRCTGLGGLSVTATSKAIERRLCRSCSC